MKQLIDLQEYFIYNLMQIKLSVKLSGIMGIGGMVMINVSDFLDTWLNENVSYVVIALGLVGLDHFIGSITHQFFLKDFCWKKNIIGLLIKLSMVLCGALIFEGIAHITKETDLVYVYLKMTTRLVVCVYPGVSAMKNMRVITNGVFPPAALVGKFDGFQKDLNIDKLKEGKKNEED